MITSLQLQDCKNFADETLSVGPFTVIVGTNAKQLRQSQGQARPLASGWMEDALARRIEAHP